MAKLKRNLLSEADQQVAQEMGNKRVGKAISGMPDHKDKENIETLLKTYERAYPGRLRRMKDNVATEMALQPTGGVVIKDIQMKMSMWMPADLQEVLEAAYPSFWTNKRHLHWFLKNFPIFKRERRF